MEFLIYASLMAIGSHDNKASDILMCQASLILDPIWSVLVTAEALLCNAEVSELMIIKEHKVGCLISKESERETARRRWLKKSLKLSHKTSADYQVLTLFSRGAPRQNQQRQELFLYAVGAQLMFCSFVQRKPWFLFVAFAWVSLPVW